MTRFIPQSYLEAADILSWLFHTFIDHKARRYYRAVVFWVLCVKVMEMLTPLCIGLMVMAFNAGASYVPALSGLVASNISRSYCAKRANEARELFIGQAFMGLDVTITSSFLAKDIGTHIREHKALSQAVIKKARERADALIHLATYWVADASLVLCIVIPVLLFLSPVICATIVTAILVGIAASSYANRNVIARADVVDEEHRENMSRRDDRLAALERVMMAAKEDGEAKHFGTRYHEVLSHDRPVWMDFHRGGGGRDLFLTIATLVIISITASNTSNGTMAVSTFVSIGTWVAVAATQVNNLAHMERQVLWSIAPLKALRTAMELPSAITNKDDGIVIGDEPVTVEFRNVSFRYPDGPLVLSDVNLIIKPGEKVALIGESGSGKSTLGKLLLRYWDPTTGVILVNGHDLRTLNLHEWRRRVGHISQRQQLFDMSVRDNLLYGLTPEARARYTDDVLLDMMRRFRVEFGAGRLKQGLDTMIGGKNGEQVSGGEAQRLLILAAVLRNPLFLVIDEATAALDNATQAEVQEALYEAMQGGTGAILIAHRLSTTRGCTRFVKMRPVTGNADESQIEAIAESIEELACHSQSFRNLAHGEGLLLNA